MSWIETPTGNRISKAATISGSENISINGHCTIEEDVHLVGDVPLRKSSIAIQIGKFCYISKGALLKPPEIGPELHGPMSIGGYSIIGRDCVIRSANIGNRVLIEPQCSIGNLAIIYDCCVIRRGTVVPPRAVIPAYSEVSGVPGENYVVKALNSSYKRLIECEAREMQVLGEQKSPSEAR